MGIVLNNIKYELIKNVRDGFDLEEMNNKCRWLGIWKIKIKRFLWSKK